MAGPEVRGGTRWKWCLCVYLAAMFAVLVMAAMTFLGVLPLNLALSGQDFKVASRPGAQVVAPQGAAAYVDQIEMKDGTIRPALKAGIGEAEISDGICLSMVLTFPEVGSYTIRVETTGLTRSKGIQAYADSMSASNADLNPKTSDGKVAALDMSNVERGGRANRDASEIEGLSGGHPGTLGLELPGAVRATDLRVTGQGAIIGGTLRISGVRLPRISHGRGVDHGECF